MSHEEQHGHDKEPMIPTSGRRMGKGLLIVVVTLAVGAAIIVPFFDAMYKFPPPVNSIVTRPPPTEQPPAEAGTTTIAILAGAAAQGSPDYNPDDARVPLGSKIVWDNQDTVPHTATSGTANNDPNKAKLFDTSIVNGGAKSEAIEITGAKEGDVINYFCALHEYMKSQLTITAAGEGGQAGGAAAGPTLNILQGAAAQGSPDYDPDELTAKTGDEITVVNQDNVPHTVTSGTANNDPNKAKLFDTSIINGGKSGTISLAEVDPGRYDYFCVVHEYMKGVLVVE